MKRKLQMNSNLTKATRTCGYQDCDERTSRPNYPLCYEHYRAFQERFIDECPNCSGIYKPLLYPKVSIIPKVPTGRSQTASK